MRTTVTLAADVAAAAPFTQTTSRTGMRADLRSVHEVLDGTDGVRLMVLDERATPRELAAALLLRTGPGQERFVLAPAQTLPQALADAGRTPFAVLTDADDVVVGAGVLDGGEDLTELGNVVDVGRSVLLRAFLIDAAHQGRGLGTAAARAVRSLAPRVTPHAEAVVLTVNEQNPGGLRAYARAGFTDVGRYLGGRSGPQRVLRAAVVGAVEAGSTT